MLLWKRSPWKNNLSPWKALDFSPKILYGPCKRSKLFFSGDYFLTSRDLFHWWCRVSISFGENWCWALLGFKGIHTDQYKHIVILWFLTMEIIIVSPCYNVHVSSINFYSGNTWKLCLPRMKVTFYLLQQSMAVSKGKNTLKFFGNSWTQLSSNKIK